MNLIDNTRHLYRAPGPGERTPLFDQFRGLVDKDTGELITPPVWDLLTHLYREVEEMPGRFVVWDYRQIRTGIWMDLSGLALYAQDIPPET